MTPILLIMDASVCSIDAMSKIKQIHYKEIKYLLATFEDDSKHFSLKIKVHADKRRELLEEAENMNTSKWIQDSEQKDMRNYGADFIEKRRE